MKKTMHCEMREMLRKRLTLHVRLTFRRLIGDHDVAEQARCSTIGFSGIGRKAKHIGRHVLMAPCAVEHAHGRVIGQHDGNLAARQSHCGRGVTDRAAHDRLGVALCLPQRRIDPDVDRGRLPSSPHGGALAPDACHRFHRVQVELKHKRRFIHCSRAPGRPCAYPCHRPRRCAPPARAE